MRVHIKDTLRDVVGVRSENLGWPLRAAMRRVASESSGVVVILRPEETPREFMDSVRSARCEARQHARNAGATVVRTYGIGAQILKDLGPEAHARVERAEAAAGLSAFDLEVTEYVDGGE